MSAVIFTSYMSISIFGRRKTPVIRNHFDAAALGLVLAYALSMAVAASPKQAIAECLKYVNYFFIYWVISDLVFTLTRDGSDPARSTSLVLLSLVLSAFGVAVLGVGAAAGTFEYAGAYDGTRISSSIQYPNSLAAYLTAAFFLSVGLSAHERRPWVSAVHAGLASGLLLPFVFTYSRGAWALFPVISVVFLIALPPEERSRSFWMLVAIPAVVLMASPFFHRALHPPTGADGARPAPVSHLAWLWYIGSIALGSLASLVARHLSLLRRRNQALMIAGAFTVAAFMLFVPQLRSALFAGVVGRQLLPQDLVRRLTSISLGEWSAASRLMWTADALRIVKDHPILGTGGGGWNAVYHAYQRWGYWTTEVHNYYAQTWVETGTVGLSALLALWLHRAHRLCRGSVRGGQALLATIGCSAMALGAHSALDFNLSLAGISFFLWTLFGAGAGLTLSIRTETARPSSRGAGSSSGDVQPALAIIIALLLAILAGRLMKAEAYGRQAASLAKQDRLEESIEKYEAAVRLDAWEPAYRVDLSTVMLALAERERDAAKLSEARTALEKAVQIEPFNSNNRLKYAALLFKAGQVENGLGQIEEALKLDPFNPGIYENLARANLQSAVSAFDKQLYAEAKRYFAAVTKVPGRMKDKRAEIPPRVPESYRMPECTPAVALDAGKAAALLGDAAHAKVLLEKAASDAGSSFEAWTWLGALCASQGETAEADEWIEKAAKADPSSKERYEKTLEALSRVPKKLQEV